MRLSTAQPAAAGALAAAGAHRGSVVLRDAQAGRLDRGAAPRARCGLETRRPCQGPGVLGSRRPWLELTTRLPRAGPPGSALPQHVDLVAIVTAKGRRSTWRASTLPPSTTWDRSKMSRQAGRSSHAGEPPPLRASARSAHPSRSAHEQAVAPGGITGFTTIRSMRSNTCARCSSSRGRRCRRWAGSARTEVVADEFGHVRVDGLVVGNPFPTALAIVTLPARAALSTPARPAHCRAQLQGIEVVVVDAR